jgi:hypothetical protein
MESTDPLAIRLFKLLPGTDRDPLRGELFEASLGSKTTYEALSYCWGDSDVVSPIRFTQHVDSHDSYFLNGTTNLCAALLRLRRPDAPRILWVDAICINQQDNMEKTRQLALMGHIYKQAARVVVWLGPGY